MNETRGQWIGAREAALLTGATVRAMQKRAARGTIAARKVTRDGVDVWEFDARELGAPKGAPTASKVDASTGAPGANMDASKVTKHAQNGVKVDASVGANMDASIGQSGRVQTDDLTARLLAQLETENSFLRGVIEQLQRDGAETRAALREALKLAPKQLTAGSELVKVGDKIGGQLEQVGTDSGSAINAPQCDERDGVSNQGATDASGQPRRPDRRGGGLRLVRDGLKAMFTNGRK